MVSRLRDLAVPSRFEQEARRLMDARLAAKTSAEKDDAEWALTFLFQMHRAGRLEEYFAGRQERD